MQGRTRPLDFGPPKFKFPADLPRFAPLNLKSCSGCDLGKWLGPNVPQFPLCSDRSMSTCLCLELCKQTSKQTEPAIL